MTMTFLDPVGPFCMAPLAVDDGLGSMFLGKKAYHDLLNARLQPLVSSGNVQVAENFWPSQSLLAQIQKTSQPVKVTDTTGVELLTFSSEANDLSVCTISKDEASFLIHYPWHLLGVNEDYLAGLSEPLINGTVRDGVTVDGILHLGKGSVLLPGVYIEGTVVIGDNCKVGPNCYVRGNTSVGDNCRVGQAVEIKNSIIMSDTAIGHLSYVGDSVVGSGVNLGAGTITANYRHDGACHRSRIGMDLIDTGRTKFGAVIGNGVHTGIHTSIYPGRKLGANSSTLPGAVVSDDIAEAKF